MLEKGAYINEPNKYLETPLHKAVCCNAIKVIAFLLEEGAEVNTVDENEHSPLYTAASHEKKEIVELLEEYGARLECGTPGLVKI